MKKRRLKIKAALFLMLVIIMGTLTAGYAAFCRGGNYNSIEIAKSPVTEATDTSDEPVSEQTTEPEPPTEGAVSDESNKNTDDASDTSASEETSESPQVKWADYNPTAELSGENWALTLISAKYPIDKSYSPSLSPVIESSSVTADSRVSDAYKKMYADALASGLVLTPYSGYCSISRQQANFDNKVEAFVLQGMTRDEAKLNAEKRVAQGGNSENNAGLSVDIISASAGFSSTKEYKWLTENAHKYGFVLRYPEDKTDITGMIYQPWHWRYVGVDAAQQMKAENKCLEEFLGAI